MPNPTTTAGPAPGQSYTDWLLNNPAASVFTTASMYGGPPPSFSEVQPLYSEPDYDDDYIPPEDEDFDDDYVPEPASPTSSWSSVTLSEAKKKLFGGAMNREVFYNRGLMEFLSSGKKVDGDIGIEIECEGTSLFDSPIRYWRCESDGSLRVKNGHPPIEYVLKKPLPISEVPAALTYLTKQLKASGSSVEESTRTSVHIHLNCQSMTMKEILTFICLYMLFENLLVEFSGPQRVGNLFCLRAKDAEFWVYSIVQDLERRGFDKIFANDYRYTSCNTASLAKYGSLEFRSMRGTVDQTTIQTWIDILVHLKEESKRFEDPAKLYEEYFALRSGDFFKSVFYHKPDLYNVLTGVQSSAERDKGILEGSIFVRDIASAIEDWKPKIKVDVPVEPVQSNTFQTGTDLSAYERYAAATSAGRVIINTSTFNRGYGHPVLPITNILSPGGKIYWDEHGWIVKVDGGTVDWMGNQ